MKVLFEHEGDELSSGVASEVSWENNMLQDAIRKTFCERPDEQVVAVLIRKSGIKALFETTRGPR